jgi:guanylate kinase
MSVSVTTRPQRPGEVEGVDYKFISKDRFDAMRDRGELLESAEVFGHWYGTPRLPVEKSLSMGRDVLFDIDWQGTQQLAEVMREDLVTIFILPPSAEVLHDRLINRAQDAMVVVAKRMAEASKEISHWAEYDYVIINQDLEVAGREISMILAAERLKRKRRTGLATFVRSLTEKL